MRVGPREHLRGYSYAEGTDVSDLVRRIGKVESWSRLPQCPALSSYHWLGIPIAIAGAVLLALGTLFQHRAVDTQGAAPGRAAGSMGGGRLQALLRKPVWLAGTAMLGAAILLQLTSLRFSPLIVVQPIGAVALVVTTLATAKMTRRPRAGAYSRR